MKRTETRLDAMLTKATYVASHSNKHALEVVFDLLNSTEVPKPFIKMTWIFSQSTGWPIKSFGLATGTPLPPVINRQVVKDFAKTIMNRCVGVIVDRSGNVRKFVPFDIRKLN